VYVGYRRPRWGLGLKPKSGISLIYIESGQREKKKLSRQMAELIETSSSVFGSITNVVIKLMWKVGYLGLGGGFLVTGLLYAKQNSMLYMPEIGNLPKKPANNPRHYRSPSEYRIPYESHMIRCEDGVTIHSWLLLQKDSEQCPTIVFFHGNAG